MANQNTTCFTDNLKCDTSDGTLVKMHLETTWEGCSDLCREEENCVAFNFFGPRSNFHPRDSCLLFSACERKVTCNDCVLGTSQDDCTCSIDYYGVIDQSNFVDTVTRVPDEVTCKDLCSKTSQCSFYTYYNGQHSHQPEVCIMLSNSGIEESQINSSGKVRSSAKKCDNCKTGPVACEYNQKCKVALLTSNGAPQAQPYVFAVKNRRVTLLTGENNCFRDLRALGIGGGGSARGSGGGGSGLPVLRRFDLRSNETLTLSVLKGGEVKVTKGGLDLLVGFKGGNSNGSHGHGGGGYSGGGAGIKGRSEGGQDGGSNGSDGLSSGGVAGGRGSGLDLASLNMTRFLLTPGRAGYGIDQYGGGGGGILVNGKKPQDDLRGGRGRGEGFGGGGAAYRYRSRERYPGFERNPGFDRNPRYERNPRYDRNPGHDVYGSRDGHPGCVLLQI